MKLIMVSGLSRYTARKSHRKSKKESILQRKIIRLLPNWITTADWERSYALTENTWRKTVGGEACHSLHSDCCCSLAAREPLPQVSSCKFLLIILLNKILTPRRFNFDCEIRDSLLGLPNNPLNLGEILPSDLLRKEQIKASAIYNSVEEQL